jgi:hypothetical protein
MPSLVQGHQPGSSKYLRSKKAYSDWKEQTGLNQYEYTVYCIDQLRKQLGYVPGLVFDRGFCNKTILKYLKTQKILCYVRAKSWLYAVDSEGERRPLSSFATGSHIVSICCKLRLVVGAKLNDHEEPWYILTTDLKKTDDEILEIYYYRFEVEELFRDMKSLLKTRGARLKKPTHLATLLWYVCLGIVLLGMSGFSSSLKQSKKWVKDSDKSTHSRPNTQKSLHPTKKLSDFRILFEEFEKHIRSHVYLSGHMGYV